MANKKNIQNLLTMNQSGSSVIAAAGFDAVKDMVTRVMKQKSDTEEVYFATIEEFAQHLLSKKNMSCSVELKVERQKPGGNMAIFSHALGTLGVKIHCLGSFGYPRSEPLYRDMNENCILYPLCETGSCNALEFNDGKVMLSTMNSLEHLTWDTLTTRMDEETLIAHFREHHLTALLNWSEVPNALKLFQEVYEHCYRNQPPDKSKWLLFDLSDASRKTPGELQQILLLIQQFAQYRTIVFSMNENEARLIHQVVNDQEAQTPESLLLGISKKISIDYLVLHMTDQAIGCYHGEITIESGYYTREPKLSTGGGDNFNAGLCFGLTHGLALADSLKLGNAVSGYYVRIGDSPTVQQLHDFINQEEVRD